MLLEHQDNPSECFMAGESEFHGRKPGVSWQETRSFMAGKSKVVKSMNLGRIKHK